MLRRETKKKPLNANSASEHIQPRVTSTCGTANLAAFAEGPLRPTGSHFVGGKSGRAAKVYCSRRVVASKHSQRRRPVRLMVVASGNPHTAAEECANTKTKSRTKCPDALS